MEDNYTEKGWGKMDNTTYVIDNDNSNVVNLDDGNFLNENYLAILGKMKEILPPDLFLAVKDLYSQLDIPRQEMIEHFGKGMGYVNDILSKEMDAVINWYSESNKDSDCDKMFFERMKEIRERLIHESNASSEWVQAATERSVEQQSETVKGFISQYASEIVSGTLVVGVTSALMSGKISLKAAVPLYAVSGAIVGKKMLENFIGQPLKADLLLKNKQISQT